MNPVTAVHTIGSPQVAGPLAVYPVFGPPPNLRYQGLAAALELGALVKELDRGASVREVAIQNPTDLPILIYEGEQITGAQQNRSFDVSVLVPAKSAIPVPVSCVEHGRWDAACHTEPFTVSEHAADPALRSIKRAGANAAGYRGRPDQQRVWSEVGDRLDAFGVQSSTDSLHDVFAQRHERLEALTRPLAPLGGQMGAVVEIAGRPVALDLVSRAEVFATLAPALASGYALQALNARAAKPNADRAERFLAKATAGRRGFAANQGLGNAFAIERSRMVGAGVEHGRELIALSIFRREQALR